jgi:hypothetical protein
MFDLFIDVKIYLTILAAWGTIKFLEKNPAVVKSLWKTLKLKVRNAYYTWKNRKEIKALKNQ